jgi:hypothetical protein
MALNVGSNDEREHGIVSGACPERHEAAGVSPRFIDVGSVGFDWVSGDREVEATGCEPREANTGQTCGQELLSCTWLEEEASRDDEHAAPWIRCAGKSRSSGLCDLTFEVKRPQRHGPRRGP